MLQFNASICCCELPVDFLYVIVAVVFPCSHFGLHSCHLGNSPIKVEVMTPGETLNM